MKKFIFLAVFLSVTFSMYSQTSKTMKIWKNGSYSLFDINEIDSVTYSEDSIEPVIPVLPDNPIYNDFSESEVQTFVSYLYVSLRDFMVSEQILESMALGKVTGTEYEINSRNRFISDTFTKAYVTIRNCNTIINRLENTNVQYERFAYMSHAWCIRGLVYYTMAQLWGDVPYVDEQNMDQPFEVKVLPKDEIISKSAHDIQKAYSFRKLYDFGTNATFNSSNITCLYLETLYESSGMYQTENTSIADLFITDSDMKVAVKVIDDTYYKLLVRSMMKLSYQTAEQAQDIANDYMKMYPHYGIWHSVKRLGVAKRYNGMAECNLFPFPEREIQANNYLKQNPGY